MLDLKIIFPRLKTYSERSIAQSHTTKTGNDTLNTISTVNNAHQNIKSLE
jgi:hypothetical protein